MNNRLPALVSAAFALSVAGACAPQAGPAVAPPPSGVAHTAAVQQTTTAARHFPSDEDLGVMLRYLVEDGETPGIVLGIVEADGSTRVFSHGTAGPGTRPLGTRTVFEIGSINKTFTGTVLADMVAKGEVALSDPVAKYLPDSVRVPSRGGREITLVDLATHTSGLPRMVDNHVPADAEDPYGDYTIETLYEFLDDHELRREIGSEYEYSNLGMGLLGHALARAAGTSFPELVRARVLEPLGMEMTGYTREGELAAWLAKGYDRAGRVAPHWDAPEAIAGAGGLRSNMEDMLTYLKANMEPAGSSLGRAMRSAQQVRRPADDDRGMGLGWQVLEYEGRTILTHGGTTGGFRTRMGFDPGKRVGYVLLTNSRDFEDDIGLDFLRRGAPLAIPEVDVAREVLERYVGTYDVAPGQSIVVRLEDDGTLTLRPPGNVRFRAYSASDSTFFLKRAPRRLRFVRDASGEVIGLVVNVEGTDRKARKVSDEAPLRMEAAPVVLDRPLTPEEIARHEGTYTLELGPRTLELRVFAENGRLKAQAAGQGAARLRYQGEHLFIPDFDDGVRLAFTVNAGRAESVTLHQDGQTATGERKP